MHGNPAVVVRKSGFFAALAQGVFGLLITAVCCATLLGGYAVYTLNHAVGGAFSLGTSVVSHWPQWRQALPPAIAESLNDRRAPEYREQVRVATRTDHSKHGDRLIIEVTNTGQETVSLLALRLVLEDQEGDPVYEVRAFAATPFVMDGDEWRGPLMPGATRKFARHVRELGPDARVSAEIADIRLQVPLPAATPPTTLAASDQ